MHELLLTISNVVIIIVKFVSIFRVVQRGTKICPSLDGRGCLYVAISQTGALLNIPYSSRQLDATGTKTGVTEYPLSASPRQPFWRARLCTGHVGSSVTRVLDLGWFRVSGVGFFTFMSWTGSPAPKFLQAAVPSAETTGLGRAVRGIEWCVGRISQDVRCLVSWRRRVVKVLRHSQWFEELVVSCQEG